MLRLALVHSLLQMIWRARRSHSFSSLVLIAGIPLTVLLLLMATARTRPIAAKPATQSNLPQLLISEVMADPNAVDDEMGEWIEIVNPTDQAVDLNQWRLVNLSNDEHQILLSVIVPPRGYVLLARHADPSLNGGVSPNYVYADFHIANDNDSLQLLDPNGQVVDSLAWGDANREAAHSGASWERVTLESSGAWVVAHSPWPGSAGDWGSPGQPYAPLPPTATPPPATAPPPTATPPPASPPRLYLSEVMIDPAAVDDERGEWIELFNGDTTSIHLAGWRLSDDDTDDTVLGDVWIEPGQYLVLGRNGDIASNGGISIQHAIQGMTFANAADEVRLIAPWGVEVDQVRWHEGLNTPQAGHSLERVDFNADQWVAAQAIWPGSAGDYGTPGSAYQLPPTPTPTATIPAQPPRLHLSEVMIDPAAVADEQGEWVELYSADSQPVDLTGWRLADQHGNEFPLAGGMVQPNQYVVLARQAEPSQNGGVAVTALYAGLQLANKGGTLRLLAPWGAEVDRLNWGNDGTTVPQGATLERTGFEGHQWLAAYTPWAGSAGDYGSPGFAYVPPPAAPPTATPLPLAWPLASHGSALQIDQVYSDGGDDEYVVLINQSNEPLALAGWRLGDAESPGKAEGMVRLPDEVLAPGARLVLARDATAFRTRWGFIPDAAWANGDGETPLLVAESHLGTRDLALNNQGDELLLLDPTGLLADAFAYGDAAYQLLGLTGPLPSNNGQAYYRAPGSAFPAVRDLRHRFLHATPNPALSYAMPGPLSHTPIGLDDGQFAWWGTLGAYSTFTANGVAPPHVVQAEAAALGLDFVAIADDARAPEDLVVAQAAPPITTLPAWRWHNTAGDSAIVYGTPRVDAFSWGDLFEHLARTNGLAQLPSEQTPVDGRTPLFAGDTLYAPGGLAALYPRWQAAGRPLLPTGNHNPPIQGSGDTRQLYTGLVAPDAAPSSLLAAMAAGRGWLTSSPDLWLALRSDDNRWMGSTLTPSNEVTLQFAFGDKQGAPVAVALWQDDQLIRQLDLPPPDGRWTVTLPAVPGTFLYAVATQLDGDFAVTAPLYVAPVAGGAALINEAWPAPDSDLNGDGTTNTDDEYIELYNPGSAPIALSGWQLHDATNSRRFTLGPGRFIAAGDYLLLWHTETGISLNDDGDELWLLDAAGNQVDQVAWGQTTRGHAYGRWPDGTSWRGALLPTPGRANEPIPVEPPQPPKAPSEPEFDPVDVADPRSPVFGQATGPAGSVARSKLEGLYATVEFRGQVTVPPGLFNSSIYVAEAALDENGAPGPLAGLGMQVYLKSGDFMPMQEGDWVLVRGTVRSFRGELEIQLDEPGRAWRIGPGTPLLPLPVQVGEIGESLEGRLVTFEGVITGWSGNSLYLDDPTNETIESVRVTVRSSLDWRRPYVHIGERYRVVGVVSQFGTEAPWNDGYRVLPRFESDLVRLEEP